jgi:PAS domain S-box-containing protein
MGVPCLAKCPFKGPKEPGTTEPLIRLTDDENTVRWVTRMATPVFGPTGKIVGCMTILQDHSPIADLIDRIHHEEQNTKIILDNLDVGIFTMDCGGHITFFNTEAENIVGYNRRQILGKPCSMIFEGSNPQEISLLKATINDGVSRSDRRGRMITRDGISIPVRINFMALKNEKGTVVGGLATFHDLTLVQQLKQATKERYTLYDMIGKSPAMEKLFEMVNVVAKADATVLIEGSTGTGKDLLARVIHSVSHRAKKPFVKVNCAAIPDNLLESEMFGYVKGAFTGAEKDKIGRFQEADNGTIFLDEIGDLPLPLQAKLLRVLEDKEFYRLGSRHTVKVNVRIISATNRNLPKLVEKRLFREDLFYRLNLFHIELPELKDRRVDLPLLIGHILRRLSSARGIRLPEVSELVMGVLLNYHYPGNIRELENILEHALILCRENTIRPEHLPEYLRYESPIRQSENPESMMDANNPETRERNEIQSMLDQYRGMRSETARALGMNRTTLWRKMKKYGIEC